MGRAVPVGPYAYGLSFGLPCVLAKCHHNALNALYKRHLSVPPHKFAGEFHPSFYSFVKTKLAPAYPYQYQEDLDKWKIGKTLEKLRAVEQSHVFDKLTLNKAKSFLKREVNPGIPTKARLIQGNENDHTAYYHPDAYKAISNLFTHIVYSVDGVDFDLHYTSHLNQNQISELFNLEIARPGFRVFDERDGKNWDSTMQEQHMRFEAGIYALFDERISSHHLMRSTRTTGTIRSTQCLVKYITAWKRLSGDWNTSTGNTIISMAITISVILSLPLHLRPRRVFGLFLGDDYLGVYNYSGPTDTVSLNQALGDGEKRFGITPVRAVFTDPLLCEFISLCCWPTYEGTYAFVPKISNMLVKLFYSTKVPSKHSAHDVHAAIRALRPCFAGLRFMQRFLSLHAVAWTPTGSARPHVDTLKEAYFYERLGTDFAHVNWAYGFAHKYRLPITALDIPLPPLTSAKLLRHPTIDLIFRLEHLDPDIRGGPVR